MPKLDSQGRLRIPSDLRQKVGLDFSDTVAICYDFLNDTISICNEKSINDKCVLAFRKLDGKGRFTVPDDVLSWLGIKEDDLIFIFLQDNKLCMKGMGGTGT